MNAQEVMVLEKKIAGHMYFKYNMIMTVGVYADNTNTELSKNMKVN